MRDDIPEAATRLKHGATWRNFHINYLRANLQDIRPGLGDDLIGITYGAYKRVPEIATNTIQVSGIRGLLALGIVDLETA